MERCGCGKVHSPFSARAPAPAKVQKLHIGCGNHVLPSWWNTDLVPYSSHVMGMDATRRFPFPDESFDRVYSEHMIEHVPLEGGRAMLAECFRVLRLGGRIRISCPDRAFINRLIGPIEGLTGLDCDYIDWACALFGLPTASAVGCNLATGFGHRHIYTYDELAAALQHAGFIGVTHHPVSESDDPELCNLENVARMPPGFLQLETMTLEAVKPLV